MSLFIAGLALEENSLDAAKVGILAGLSAILGLTVPAAMPREGK